MQQTGNADAEPLSLLVHKIAGQGVARARCRKDLHGSRLGPGTGADAPGKSRA